MIARHGLVGSLLLLAAAAGWGVAAGCSGGGGGGKDFGDTACFDCIASACSSEVSTCEAESDCDDTLACVEKCNADSENRPNGDCVDACANSNLSTTAGANAWNDLAGCYANNVDSTCLSDCS
jgi:hypothetical protein